jgi:hypothetical protein
MLKIKSINMALKVKSCLSRAHGQCFLEKQTSVKLPLWPVPWRNTQMPQQEPFSSTIFVQGKVSINTCSLLFLLSHHMLDKNTNECSMINFE